MISFRHLAGSAFRLCRQLLQWAMLLIVYPLVLIFFAVTDKKYYFVSISMVNIGGLATTVDAFLRRRGNAQESVEYVFVRNNKRIANEYFYGLLKRKLLIPENSLLRLALSPLVNTNNSLNLTHSLSYLKADEIELYPRVTWFEESDHVRGKELLSQLGMVGSDAWYVCFNARDNAFGRAHYSAREFKAIESFHSCRNSDIDTHIKAMKFILDQGGYVIRIGSIVEKPVSFTHPRLIDYPYSQFKSDFADVYLPCHCKFIIGDASGVVDLSWIVDMPFGRVNEPIYALKWVRPNIMFTPKIIKNEASGKCLTIDEFYKLYDSGRIDRFYTEMRRQGMVYIDNSEDDILQITEAMYRTYILGEKVSYVATPNCDIWPPFLAYHPELLGE